MAHEVTLIPGDGIGPETTGAARRCLDASGAEIEWDVQQAGLVAAEREKDPLPERVVSSIKQHKVALKGPMSTPAKGYRSANLALRERLGLYAGIRPCKALSGVPTPFPLTDIVVVRMITEDLYAGIEYGRGRAETKRLREWIAESDGTQIPDDAGISVKPISVSAASRIVHRAFQYAEREGRSKVTAVHKATVMRQTDGLFLDVAREIAAEYPRTSFDERLVDTVCHDLVMRPGRCDVLVLPMLYGDIVSDIGAGLIGGLGMAPGVNLADDCAVFEAAHGTAPRHAGHNRANPVAVILSGAMMLRHLGEIDAADRLEGAVAAVVSAGRTVTYDLIPSGGPATPAGTSEVADAVIAELGRAAAA